MSKQPEDKRNVHLATRFSPKEMAALDDLSTRFALSRTEVLARGIALQADRAAAPTTQDTPQGHLYILTEGDRRWDEYRLHGALYGPVDTPLEALLEEFVHLWDHVTDPGAAAHDTTTEAGWLAYQRAVATHRADAEVWRPTQPWFLCDPEMPFASLGASFLEWLVQTHGFIRAEYQECSLG